MSNAAFPSMLPFDSRVPVLKDFWCDLQRVSKIVQEITGAVKLNYEIHGNTIPHLHVHLFPRYKGDAFEDDRINTQLTRKSPYRDREFETFTHTL